MVPVTTATTMQITPAMSQPRCDELRRVTTRGSPPAAWGGVHNTVLNAIWRRRAIAASVDAETTPDGRPCVGYEPFGPLVVCREKGVLFHAPSPSSGRMGTLADCVDADLLARLQQLLRLGHGRRTVIVEDRRVHVRLPSSPSARRATHVRGSSASARR